MNKVVYHTEHGKGQIVGEIQRGTNSVLMCFFPSNRTTEFVDTKALENDTDEMISRHERPDDTDTVSDKLQQAIESLFSGGQPMG
jgi:hypothetical protein